MTAHDSAPRAALRGAGRAAIAVGFAVFAGFALVRLSGFPYDDAFIHLRIARRLAESGEPFYNSSEPVLGSTSPLWVLLLAVLQRVGFDGVAAARLLGAIALAILVIVLERLLGAENGNARRPFRTFVAAILTVLLALPTAGFLMETPLALALLLSGALALAGGVPAVAGALLVLAGATRPELALSVLMAPLLAREGRARYCLGAAAAGLPILAFLLIDFGTIVPHPVIAKRIVYPLSWKEVQLYLPLPFVLTQVVAATAVLGLARGRSDSRRNVASQLLAAQGLAALLAYLAAHAFVFPWYVPLVSFPIVVGTLTVGVDRLRVPRRRNAVLGGALVAAAVAAAAVPAIAGFRDLRAVLLDRPAISVRTAENARVEAYLAIGRLITTRCPGAIVMAPEIGALGWTYRGKVVDAVGLVSPEVLPFHPLSVPSQRDNPTLGAVPYLAVATLRPDVLVVMDTFASDLARNEAGVRALGYSPIGEFSVYAPWLRARGLPALLWGTDRVLVAARGRCRGAGA